VSEVDDESGRSHAPNTHTHTHKDRQVELEVEGVTPSATFELMPIYSPLFSSMCLFFKNNEV